MKEKVINSVFNEIDKEGKCVQEASATIESTKREIVKVTMEIIIGCSNNTPRQSKTFQQGP